MKLVCDACVAVKWFVPETLSNAADALLTGEHQLCAPDFMLVEVANTLWKKVRLDRMSPGDAEKAIFALTAGAVEMLPTAPLLPRALEIAHDIGHPVYDCIYLAAAEAWRATLVTADLRLARAAESGAWKAMYKTLDQWTPAT